MQSKELIVYIDGSYYKYHNLYVDHLHEITEKGHLIVYERDSHTGEEAIKAEFREWSYYIIEADSF